MVLPILILIVFTLMLVMVHYYTAHHGQITLHREMTAWSYETDAVFRIQKKTQKQQTKLDGAVNHFLMLEKEHRIYGVKPARWILLGEMAGFADG